MQANSKATFKKAITKEEINQLPLGQYSGKIHLIRRVEDVQDAVKQLQQETVLGFDTETKPSFKKGVSHLPALLQLAGSKAVYIFQIKLIQLPPPLREILSNPNIIKTGVALDHDIQKLQEIAPFFDAGFVDLRTIAEQIGIKHTGLRSLAANLLGFRVSKSAQLSNWAREELSQNQIIYAATDAWVSRELYLVFRDQLKANIPVNGSVALRRY
ncbi:MAG: 3'-5' exonuclease domain-containing protein 2 [Gemmatimonadetes bacterium]|nr:MAG: 3'-5' exonuclease domain-containing protein 2 [Gemmatimonadota bacterium]